MASAVRCTSCGYESCTRDPFLDVNLEVAGAGSVTGALERFTAGEALDGANRYRCPREGRPVRAVKSLRIASPPAVLALQLKRFGFGGHGHKVTKRVDFGPVLDLGPFLGLFGAAPSPATPAGGFSFGFGAASTPAAATALDDDALADVYGLLSQQTAALAGVQAVLRRAERDLEVLEGLAAAG
ncbi:Ubiquitin carboxyl-terminal hydrolase 25 [Auxenochlorella protothecoides]|uniref:ubiquitinyl hydrolase 1 n=2 Tax=Auxenochlorella protothecoides TaxID=3075 RepID=A0A087SAL6_AUXPR|nr:Ubiquitin carboxyl-terminal hydrolase 25 [Auxenochlorella protothecoides]KFM22770.1 Ubiquitin carboxyl-terminal hydrolase 25 [Auxenochlorella protothecoides]